MQEQLRELREVAIRVSGSGELVAGSDTIETV